MKEYHVVWRIEVHAEDEVDAAIEAQNVMNEGASDGMNWSFEVVNYADWQQNGDRANFVHVHLDEHLTTD